MLTRKQHELLSFINERLSTSGISPSFEEMKEALDLKSKSGVHQLISALEERGFIRSLTNRARAIEVMTMQEPSAAQGEEKADNNIRPDLIGATKLATTVVEYTLHGRTEGGNRGRTSGRE